MEPPSDGDHHHHRSPPLAHQCSPPPLCSLPRLLALQMGNTIGVCRCEGTANLGGCGFRPLKGWDGAHICGSCLAIVFDLTAGSTHSLECSGCPFWSHERSHQRGSPATNPPPQQAATSNRWKGRQQVRAVDRVPHCSILSDSVVAVPSRLGSARGGGPTRALVKLSDPPGCSHCPWMGVPGTAPCRHVELGRKAATAAASSSSKGPSQLVAEPLWGSQWGVELASDRVSAARFCMSTKMVLDDVGRRRGVFAIPADHDPAQPLHLRDAAGTMYVVLCPPHFGCDSSCSFAVATLPEPPAPCEGQSNTDGGSDGGGGGCQSQALDAAPRWYQWLHADHLGCPPLAPTAGGSSSRRECSVPGCLGAQSALPSKGSHLCFHHAQAIWGRAFVSCAVQAGCVLLDDDGSPDASVQVRPPPNTAVHQCCSPSQHPVHLPPPLTACWPLFPLPLTTCGGAHHCHCLPPQLATSAHHHRSSPSLITVHIPPLATAARHRCSSPPLTHHHRSPPPLTTPRP